MVVTGIIIILFFVFLQGLLSCTEMSVVSSNKLKIKSLAQKGNKSARILENFINKPHKFFGTTLVGINIFIVISSTIAASTAASVLEEFYPALLGWESVISLFIVLPLVLFFGEIIPLNLGRNFNTYISLKMARVILVFHYLLFPAVIIATNISKLVSRIFGGKDKTELLFSSKEEIELLFKEGHRAGILDKESYIMLSHIFGFKDTTIEEIMVPLIKVKMLEENETLNDLFEKVKKTGHSRFPIYKERVDKVTGIINAKKVLRYGNENLNIKLNELVEKPYFVPETKPVYQLLQGMRVNNTHIAIVVNEYGGVEGIVTLEDIIEEVIGDIQDEFDKDEEMVKEVRTGDIIVSATIELDELNEEYGIKLESEEVETLAGFLTDRIDRIPVKDEIIKYKKYRFVIVEVTDRKIVTVKIISDEKRKS